MSQTSGRRRYSDEEKQFLVRENPGKSFAVLTEMFNDTFGTQISKHALEMYCRTMLGLKSGDRHAARTFKPKVDAAVRELTKECRNVTELMERFAEQYPDIGYKALRKHLKRYYPDFTVDGEPAYSVEQEEWLRENAAGFSMKGLVEAFNSRFGTQKTYYSLEAKVTANMGISRRNAPIDGKTRFTPEMVAAIRELASTDMTYKEISQEINRRFGTHTNAGNICDICTKRFGIHRKGNRGQYQKGERREKYSVGEKVMRGEYEYVKKDSSSSCDKAWVCKQRHIYEQTHGEIPDGYIVIFLDGDKHNFSPENLYAVPRSIHARMCQNGWYTCDREHTITGIKVCELNEMLKNGGKSNGRENED